MAVTSEDLKSILDAKLSPLYSEITNLKEQLWETNSFLEEVLAKYKGKRRNPPLIVNTYSQREVL